MKNSNLTSSSEELVKSIFEPATADVLEAVAEQGADIIVSEFTKNEAILAIPIFGTIIKISKGLLDFRDKLYVKKIAKFLFELREISEPDKEKFRNKLDNDPEEANNAGEALLEILDNMSQSEKASLLGRIFHAYIAEEFELPRFVLLAEMVNRLYLHDIHGLLQEDNYDSQNLISAGVRKLSDMNTIYNEVNKGLGYAISTGHSSGGISFTTGYTEEGQELKRILIQYKA